MFPYILGDICQSADRFPSGRLNVWQFRPELVATTKFAVREVKKIQRHEFHPPANSVSSACENLIGAIGQYCGSIMINASPLNDLRRVTGCAW